MVSHQPQPDQSHSGRLPQQNNRLFIFVLIGFCLFFFLRYTNRLIEYGQEVHNVQLWEEKVEQVKLESAELLTFQRHVQTNAYVEEVSRLELLMAQPGDTLVVVLPDEQSESLDDTASTSLGVDSSPSENVLPAEKAVPSIPPDEQSLDIIVSGATPSFVSAVEDGPVWRQWLHLFSQTD